MGGMAVEGIEKLKIIILKYTLTIMSDFNEKVAALRKAHEELLSKPNKPSAKYNGIYEK